MLTTWIVVRQYLRSSDIGGGVYLYFDDLALRVINYGMQYN